MFVPVTTLMPATDFWMKFLKLPAANHCVVLICWPNRAMTDEAACAILTGSGAVDTICRTKAMTCAFSSSSGGFGGGIVCPTGMADRQNCRLAGMRTQAQQDRRKV